MTQFFYTDPLAAAFMAKHFGMKFGIQYESGDFNWNPGYDCGRKWQEIVRWNEFAGPLYVHPDSLSLLEPLADDQMFCPNLYKTYRAISEAARYPHEINITFARECNLRIIQRDRKPFFWPESSD